MDFSEDWKKLFGVCSVHNPPLLLRDGTLGPTCFQPVRSPKTLTVLFASPSLSPPILSPRPSLSLPRFLQTFDPSNSVAPSLSFGLAEEIPDIGLNLSPAVAASLRHNRLQLLSCPDGSVLALFLTGHDCDQVGYVALSLKGNAFEVEGERSGDVFVSSKKLNSRIISLLANPVPDSMLKCAGNAVLIGYILCFTMYAVHWFRVGFQEGAGAPVLEFFGSKVFRSGRVIHACWNPHLPHECAVLLENGVMFLFDLSYDPKITLLSSKVNGTKLRVPWVGDKSEWLSCEFSWHPRILVVARSDSVFSVDTSKSVECCTSCLANVEMLGVTGVTEEDRFVALSRAGSDGFYFALASQDQLLLLDIRKALNPLLRWAHGLKHPEFIDVLRLSQLRANSGFVDERQKWASECGFCIILGSFWSSEFCMFCCGPAVPAPRGSLASRMSELCRSFYAWGLPSDIDLSGRECPCGSCLVMDLFSKDAVPNGIDRQGKKEIVLGYGILDEDLSKLLFKPDSFGGFTLIRLTSSGRLELERYRASWEPGLKLEDAHMEIQSHFEDTLLVTLDDGSNIDKFTKRYKYFKSDYLQAYLDGNLSRLIVSNIIKDSKTLTVKKSFNADFHNVICEKVRACGFIPGSASAPSDAFRHISLPTSALEVATMKLWAGLPVPMLQLAFSCYAELLEVLVDKRQVSMEFLEVPDIHPQLPPFYLRKPSERSNKWSHNVQRSDGLVGPILPLPVLQIICEVRKCQSTDLLQEVDQFSPEDELKHQIDEVISTAQEVAVLKSAPDDCNDNAVPLSSDNEETWAGPHTPKTYLLYNQVAFSENCPPSKSMHWCDISKGKREAALISKLHLKLNVPNSRVRVGFDELFDDLCSVDTKLNSLAVDPEPQEMQLYKSFKGQYSKWQRSYNLYKAFQTDC